MNLKLCSVTEMNSFHFNPKVKNSTALYSYISLELHTWQSGYVIVALCSFDETIIALSAVLQRDAL